MSEQPPRIEYPCRYPIKVMGAADADLAAVVLEIGRRHAREVSEDDVSVRTSRKGNWVSVTLVIEAQSEAQIAAIFDDVRATGLVELVL